MMPAIASAPRPTTCRPASAHELSSASLAQASRLVVFNWVVAAYAHSDWLGPWATLLDSERSANFGASASASSSSSSSSSSNTNTNAIPNAIASASASASASANANPNPRLLHRASSDLLRRHDLNRRCLERVGDWAWLLLPLKQLMPVAHAVGVAMLGGWVRNSLDRAAVAQQLRVLSVEQRAAALGHAERMKALPFSTSGSGWPLTLPDASAVSILGLSCMAALLVDANSGSKERFHMRFVPDQLSSLVLNDAQRDDAQALIRSETDRLPAMQDIAGMPHRWEEVCA